MLAELQTIDRVANNTAGRVGRTTSRAIGDVEKSAVKGSLGLARVNNSMIQLMRTTTGASPIMGQLTDVIGTFAFGIGPMVGVLAGVTGLAIGFQKITQRAREAKDAAAALTIELGKLARSENIGALGGRFGTNTLLFSGDEFAVQGRDENDKKIDESDAEFLLRRRGILGARAEIERLKSEIQRITGGATAGARLRAAAVERDQLAKLEAELGKVETRYKALIGRMREMETLESNTAAARVASLRDGKGTDLSKLLRDETGATDIGNLRFADGLKSGGFFNPAEQWQQIAEMMGEGLKKTKPLAPIVTTDDLLKLMRWDQVVEGMGRQMGVTLSDSIANGITAAIQTGSISKAFGAMTGTILEGIGSMMIEAGTHALAFAKLWAKLQAWLVANPIAAIPAAIALIAGGSALRALGASMGGQGGGRGLGGGSFGSGFSGSSSTIIDRGLINPLNGVVTSPGTLTPRNAVHVTAIVYGSPHDPVTQRHFVDVVRKGLSREGVVL